MTHVAAGPPVLLRGPHGRCRALLGRQRSATQNPGLSRTTNIPNLTGMVQVAAGVAHACAVHATGTVRCWGEDFAGQLGGSSTTTDVPGLTGATQVVAGEGSTCALLTGGTVRCWGRTRRRAPRRRPMSPG
ncbi:MAG: RCC1 domain-containing protein [Polyangiales bacterium]